MPPRASHARGAKGSRARKESKSLKSSPTNVITERGIPGFRAMKYRCKLNYYEGTISMASGAGSAGTYVYSGNGLYDPDITSTGHQPMSFDQMMLSFEHYVVLRSKMVCTFRNSSTPYPANVSISLNAGSTPVTNYTALVENGMIVRTKVFPTAIAESITNLSMSMDVAKFGSIPNLLNNPDYKGTVSSNPAEQSYFHVSIWNPIDITVVTVNIEVFIEYEAVFFEPRKNSLSLNQLLLKHIIAEEKCKK